MIAHIIRIQKEIARHINENPDIQTNCLDELAKYVNKISPYEITERPGGYTTIVRNKKTLKEI